MQKGKEKKKSQKKKRNKADKIEGKCVKSKRNPMKTEVLLHLQGNGWIQA